MAKPKGRPFKKHHKPSGRRGTSTPAMTTKISYVKLPPGVAEGVVPTAAERQAQIEQVLGLKLGDLSPGRVAARQRVYEFRLRASVQESIDETQERGRRYVRTG